MYIIPFLTPKVYNALSNVKIEYDFKDIAIFKSSVTL